MARFTNHLISKNRKTRKSRLDYGTAAGVIAGIGLVFLSILLSGRVSLFFDLTSFLIVLGGTLGATLITFPIEDFTRTLSVLKNVFYPGDASRKRRIQRIVEMSLQARKDGTLSLQEELYYETDPFLKKCIELLVDDLPPERARRILEIELSVLEDRHRRGAEVFQTMGTVAPAMGLIGTLIGLIQMLQSIDEPSAIGPAMALALLTTFYGALLAHLVFIPMAGKLRSRSAEEQLIKEITLEGVLAISQKTNPRLIEQQLLGYLPPQERVSQFG